MTVVLICFVYVSVCVCVGYLQGCPHVPGDTHTHASITLDSRSCYTSGDRPGIRTGNTWEEAGHEPHTGEATEPGAGLKMSGDSK